MSVYLLRRVLATVGYLGALAAFCLGARVIPTQAAQQQAPKMESELSVQNFAHVAASAAEIKSILLKDAGLLIELKRWVAKQATSHGQIVSDSDLADEAIFDRLETDVPFRAAATDILQKYGYLVPRLNPQSDAAKENDLIMQERVRLVARDLSTGTAPPRKEPPSPGPQPEPARIESAPAVAPGPGTLAEDKAVAAEPGSPEQQDGALPFGAQENENRVPSQDAGVRPDLQRISANVLDSPVPGITVFPPMSGRSNSGAASRETSGSGSASSDSLASSLTPVVRGIAPPPVSPAIRPADLVRASTPYTDIPSLYDMYLQAMPKPAAPGRFGAEVFANGSRDPQFIPMDLPAGPEYIVGPGDSLALDLWGSISQRLVRTVDREGRISLPEVGPVLVSGKSLSAVQETLQRVLRTEFRDVSADVSLARLRTIRVYEVGEIAKPGAYDISSLSTPLNALFAAGGPTAVGSMRRLKHYRGTQLVQSVDLYDLLLHGVKKSLTPLENGDTIQVPPIGPQVAVEGMVRRPAVYELLDERSLSDVIELAGGLLPSATLSHVEVQRLVDHQKQTMLSLEISESESAPAVTKQLNAFPVHDGDRIRIYPIAPYTQDSIFLDGHVLRPGRYSFQPHMRVTDLIGSYSDLLPEPSPHYAEIIRLNPPDFHPSVEAFDLSAALADPEQAPELRPMDTVRVFSRFEFEDPPSVSVMGAVREPGTYRTSGQIRLTDAIELAGGLAPDAETADAQVFRSLPDGTFRIRNVSLSRAVAGDPVNNILLETHDRLLVHKNPNSVEVATVYVQGEVASPGRYPLTTDMSVADLIRVGGGLKPGADASAADLTRLEWSAAGKLSGKQEQLSLSSALASDSAADVPLRNGDVLTIRQVPGWNDLGASVTLKGEVRHPGTYGIRPGEHLSSVIERAGGFGSNAYPYGAVLQRPQVREIESKAQAEILNRLRDAQTSLELLPETDDKQKQAKAMAIEQAQSSIEQLSASPVVGRVTIRITSQMERWKNTFADIEMRAGDTITVPKKPSWVMVSGQVYNPTAVSFRPGKSAKWYLAQAGGPTQMGNKKDIFIVRADGSVIGARRNLVMGDSLSATLQPGDTVVVPERAVGGGVQWQTVLFSAQAASAIASTVFIALHY